VVVDRKLGLQVQAVLVAVELETGLVVLQTQAAAAAVMETP
jgi:hypothetical protein